MGHLLTQSAVEAKGDHRLALKAKRLKEICESHQSYRVKHWKPGKQTLHCKADAPPWRRRKAPIEAPQCYSRCLGDLVNIKKEGKISCHSMHPLNSILKSQTRLGTGVGSILAYLETHTGSTLHLATDVCLAFFIHSCEELRNESQARTRLHPPLSIERRWIRTAKYSRLQSNRTWTVHKLHMCIFASW